MDNNIDVFVEQIKDSKDEELRTCIEEWFEKIRTQSMKIGASYIAAAVYATIKKHVEKPDASLRDYKRMTKELIKITSVQLKTKGNKTEEDPEGKEEEV